MSSTVAVGSLKDILQVQCDATVSPVTIDPRFAARCKLRMSLDINATEMLNGTQFCERYSEK